MRVLYSWVGLDLPFVGDNTSPDNPLQHATPDVFFVTWPGPNQLVALIKRRVDQSLKTGEAGFAGLNGNTLIESLTVFLNWRLTQG